MAGKFLLAVGKDLIELHLAEDIGIFLSTFWWSYGGNKDLGTKGQMVFQISIRDLKNTQFKSSLGRTVVER